MSIAVNIFLCFFLEMFSEYTDTHMGESTVHAHFCFFLQLSTYSSYKSLSTNSYFHEMQLYFFNMSIHVLLETSILPGCRNKNLAKLRDSLLFILKWHLINIGSVQLEGWEGSSRWTFFNQHAVGCCLPSQTCHLQRSLLAHFHCCLLSFFESGSVHLLRAQEAFF